MAVLPPSALRRPFDYPFDFAQGFGLRLKLEQGFGLRRKEGIFPGFTAGINACSTPRSSGIFPKRRRISLDKSEQNTI
jgi:hypothetical protein